MDFKIGPNADVSAAFDPSKGQVLLIVTETDAYGSTTVTRSLNARIILDAIGKLGTVEQDVVNVLEKVLLPAAPAA